MTLFSGGSFTTRWDADLVEVKNGGPSRLTGHVGRKLLHIHVSIIDHHMVHSTHTLFTGGIPIEDPSVISHSSSNHHRTLMIVMVIIVVLLLVVMLLLLVVVMMVVAGWRHGEGIFVRASSIIVIVVRVMRTQGGVTGEVGGRRRF